MKKLIATSTLFLALAACTSGTSGGGGAVLPSVPSLPSATGSAGPARVSNVCALLAKSDAEAVVGTVTDTPAGTSVPSVPGVAGGASACVYRGASGVLTVAVVDRATSRADFDNAARAITAQPIPGLGDAAYGGSAGTSGVGGSTVLVLKGSTYLSLSATSTTKTADALLDGLKTLARTAIAKL